MHKRSEKVAEAIHELVCALLVKEIKDPRIGFATITGVQLSDDLHFAKIFFSVVGDEEQRKATEKGLNSARGFIRKEMGKAFRMKYIPDIIFKYDESIDKGDRIERLLKEIATQATADDE